MTDTLTASASRLDVRGWLGEGFEELSALVPNVEHLHTIEQTRI
jgi:hypothetical protein